MNRFLIGVSIFLGIFFVGLGLHACEMHFSLVFPDGSEQEVVPGKSVSLASGNSYTLKVEFIQDHRKCVTPPDQTVYLLQDEKWKSTKDYLPLQLLAQSEWHEATSDSWLQEIGFRAVQQGEWELEVIRNCPKGGYDEYIAFQVK